MLWPPFYIGIAGGAVYGLGYGFLFSKPNNYARVDVAMLMAQWLLGIIVAGVIILKAKNWVPKDESSYGQKVGLALKEGFKRSRWWLAVLLGFVVMKLFTPAGDQGKQSAMALIFFIGYLPIYALILLWYTRQAYCGVQPIEQSAQAKGVSWKRVFVALIVLLMIIRFFAENLNQSTASRFIFGDEQMAKPNNKLDEFGGTILPTDKP